MQLLYWQCSFSSQCAPLSEILYGSPPPSTICMHLQKSNIIFNIAFNLKVNVTQLKIWKWDLFFYFMTGSLLLKQIMTSDLLLQHQIGLTKKSNNLTSLAPILDSFGHFDIYTKFFRVTSINPPSPRKSISILFYVSCQSQLLRYCKDVQLPHWKESHSSTVFIGT